MDVMDNKRSLYNMAMILLYVLHDEDTYSDLSNLAFVLDRKNFEDLIDHFGGCTIRIPTRKEVNEMLKALVYYQLYYNNDFSFVDAKKYSGVSDEEAELVGLYADNIKLFLTKANIDNLTAFSKDLIDDNRYNIKDEWHD